MTVIYNLWPHGIRFSHSLTIIQPETACVRPVKNDDYIYYKYNWWLNLNIAITLIPTFTQLKGVKIDYWEKGYKCNYYSVK